MSNTPIPALKEFGYIPGVIFTLSNDGGKTGIYWRESVFEVLYHKEQYGAKLEDYHVVAVRNPNPKPEGASDAKSRGPADTKVG